MKPEQVSASLRQLADRTRKAFPGMAAHQHMADAAGALDRGHAHGAERHLNAAISAFTPGSIRRYGIGDDVSHVAARKLMSEAYRHLLLVKDTQDGPGPTAAHLSAGYAPGIELARRAVGL